MKGMDMSNNKHLLIAHVQLELAKEGFIYLNCTVPDTYASMTRYADMGEVPVLFGRDAAYVSFTRYDYNELAMAALVQDAVGAAEARMFKKGK